ncbi:MAG: magnesium transporter CorA family protein [Spirochaetaceae bacterium]|nr:MAG: magnesium transporter CorA family protein [Spirochaetaceae bacterium]
MVQYFRCDEGLISEATKETCAIVLYIKPKEDEIRELTTQYGIDEHNINSALDQDELGRLEIEDNHVVVIIKRPKNYCTDDELLFKVTSMGCFLFQDKLVIVMPEDIQVLWTKQAKRVKSLRDALLRVIYGTISHFLSHLKIISLLSDSLEDKIDTSVENRYLQNMFALEKSLVYYYNGIHSNSVLFEKLKNNAAKIGFSEDNLDVLDDIIIENSQCFKQAEIYTNIISGIMSTHASIVGNNLNITIHRLTLITTIFMPLTFLAGIGGMSEWTMMTEAMGWPLAYSLLLVGMVLIGCGTYFFLKWLSSPKSSRRNKNLKKWGRKSH